VQDEPENQGAAPYFVDAARRAGKRDISVVSRPASASPAVGTAKRHAVEQSKLMADALTV
jgi:2-oxoglutarate dehydrogenase E1 component